MLLDERVRTSKQRRHVTSANGPITLSTEVDSYVPALDLAVTVCVADDTPALLSLGLLVRKERFSFLWDAGAKAPLVWDEDGNQVHVFVHCDVPYVHNTERHFKHPQPQVGRLSEAVAPAAEDLLVDDDEIAESDLDAPPAEDRLGFGKRRSGRRHYFWPTS